MSIFVGNISKNVKKSDMQDEFEKFGKCDINFKVPILLLLSLLHPPEAKPVVAAFCCLRHASALHLC
jgi:RNA recognition motif-containing protein